MIQKEGRFNEERSRFYAAELIVALEYIHKKGYIVEDLKTNNILLAENGHIKLTKFIQV